MYDKLLKIKEKRKMMKEKILNQYIERLDISDNTLDILKQNKIVFIKDICRKNKTSLKQMGLTNQEICKLEIELQLLGLDLKTQY